MYVPAVEPDRARGVLRSLSSIGSVYSIVSRAMFTAEVVCRGDQFVEMLCRLGGSQTIPSFRWLLAI